MATVSGSLKFVSGSPDLVQAVGVAAVRPRPSGDGLITGAVHTFPVSGGRVSFPCEPGRAVMTLQYLNAPVEAIPIVVGTGSSYSLSQVVKDGAAVDAVEESELTGILEQVRAQAQAVADSQKAAKTSEDKAASSASAAKSSENAAKGHADRASSLASAAKTSESNAKTSESNAADFAAAAKADAGRAKTSESNASSSASNAKTSENAAKGHADRAGKIAESTSWSGDKLTVNGKTSPSLTGPQGPKGDKGQDGEVRFESLTSAQKETLRGPAGVVVSTTEPADKDVVWVDPSGANLDLLSNAFYVTTDAEAAALSGKVPKGTYVVVAQSGNVYREE